MARQNEPDSFVANLLRQSAPLPGDEGFSSRVLAKVRRRRHIRAMLPSLAGLPGLWIAWAPLTDLLRRLGGAVSDMGVRVPQFALPTVSAIDTLIIVAVLLGLLCPALIAVLEE